VIVMAEPFESHTPQVEICPSCHQPSLVKDEDGLGRHCVSGRKGCAYYVRFPSVAVDGVNRARAALREGRDEVA
jgi:hypothetical protein